MTGHQTDPEATMASSILAAGVPRFKEPTTVPDPLETTAADRNALIVGYLQMAQAVKMAQQARITVAGCFEVGDDRRPWFDLSNLANHALLNAQHVLEARGIDVDSLLK